MCKIGIVDHEYIRDTCDMSSITEKYLMMEMERYVQRYASQTMTDTSDISSTSWKFELLMSQKLTQQLKETFKQWEYRMKMRKEIKQLQEDQATFLLAQQLQFEKQRKSFEEE